MTAQVILLLAIVFMALIVFIGGWLSVDLVGLLVLSALPLLGFLSPEEALARFSSPAASLCCRGSSAGPGRKKDWKPWFKRIL